jgi:hypothetical protein
VGCPIGIPALFLLCLTAFGQQPLFAQTKATKPFVEPPAVDYSAMIAAASGKPDFRHVRWGMRQVEVKAAENQSGTSLVESNGDVQHYNCEIANLKCALLYTFVTDKLISAMYMVTEQHSNDNLYIADFEKLKKILTEKYGSPFEKDIWSQDLYRNDPSHYGMAISVGHLTKGARWSTGRTVVGLILRGDNFKISLAVSYQSSELGHLETEIQKKKDLTVF